jgi:hypothetical protein
VQDAGELLLAFDRDMSDGQVHREDRAVLASALDLPADPE